jgi:phospholipid transport system transporter-binding protein
MRLPERATFADAPALLQTLQQALGDGASAPVRIDASGLQAFDTSALALLMHASRLSRAAGRSFEVVGAPAKLLQLASLYGVEALLSLSPAGPSAAA